MKAVSDTLKALLLMVAIFAIAEAGLLFRDVRNIAHEASGTLAEVHQAATGLREYSTEQIANLRDPRNKKAIDAAIATAAVFNGTGRLINTQVIPRAMKTLDSVNLTVQTLNASAESLNALIKNTDTSINSDLLPKADDALTALTGTLQQTENTVKTATAALELLATDSHALLANPSLAALLASARDSADHLDAIAGQLEEASKQAPAIAKSVEQIAVTSSRYRRAILLSQILSAIGRAFF